MSIDKSLKMGDDLGGGINYKAILFTLFRNWYWFVFAIAIAVFGAWCYLRYTVPTYMVTSSVIIDETKNTNDINLESIGLGGAATSSSNNVNSEIMMMGSRTMIRDVIAEMNFNVTYSAQGSINDVELYNSSPIIVSLPSEEMAKLNSKIELEFQKSDEGELEMLYRVGDEEIIQQIKSLPTVVETPMGRINISAPNYASFDNWTVGSIVKAVINTPDAVAERYKESLTIAANSSTPGIVNFSFVTTNRQRGIDFVNKLIEIYNRRTAAAKNETVINTSNFIAERLQIIDAELSSTEKEIEAFKRQVGSISVEEEAQYTYSKNKAYKEMLVELASQQRLLNFFKEHLLESKSSNGALPINVGVEDVGLTSLVEEYNAQLAERKRIALISSEKNPAMVTFDTNLATIYENIISVINSVESNLKIRQAEIEREAAKYDRKLQNAPKQEREFLSITRQQEIKAGLYLLLLQKREENALMVASTTNSARIYEETVSLGGPISPDAKQIYMIALILGLIIPAGLIYLRELLRFKIEGRRDIEKITDVPLVGTIPYIKKMPSKDNSIVVMENKNDMMAEAFRDLRTNILFMLSGGKKVMLVTSTHPNEGKSYTSINLAMSIALMGKRVVVVGLDIRKPGINATLGTSSKQNGISSYLSGQTKDLLSLINKVPLSTDIISTTDETQPCLYVLYGGPIPPNPTELLSRDTMATAIEILKENFDYIILDTAPVGVVTDIYQFSRYVDLSLYICRANVTHKSDYELINSVSRSEKLPNLCTAIVGVNISSQRYGYGSRYGYSYGGYGYTEESDKKSKKRKRK